MTLDNPNTAPNIPNSLGRSSRRVTWPRIVIMAMTAQAKNQRRSVYYQRLQRSQIPAAPTPEKARPKMRTLTSLQAPQMAEPTSKTVIAERRTYSARAA